MTSRSKKPPSFPLVRAALYLAGAASAVVGCCGWILPGLSPAAIVWASFAALSAIVVPAALELLGRSAWSLLGLAPAAIFGAVNAYSFHHAYDVLISEPARAAYVAEVISPLDQRLVSA